MEEQTTETGDKGEWKMEEGRNGRGNKGDRKQRRMDNREKERR